MTNYTVTSTDQQDIVLAWAARHTGKTVQQVAQEQFSAALQNLGVGYNSSLIAASTAAYTNADAAGQAAILALLGIDLNKL